MKYNHRSFWKMSITSLLDRDLNIGKRVKPYNGDIYTGGYKTGIHFSINKKKQQALTISYLLCLLAQKSKTIFALPSVDDEVRHDTQTIIVFLSIHHSETLY